MEIKRPEFMTRNLHFGSVWMTLLALVMVFALISRVATVTGKQVQHIRQYEQQKRDGTLPRRPSDRQTCENIGCVWKLQVCFCG